MNILLEIKNLQVNFHQKTILKDLNLGVRENTIHVILGPNGSGKSTLSRVLAGERVYQVCSGEILFNGVNLSPFSPDQRAHQGIFLGFQSPIEIPGLNLFDFLRTLFNQKQKYLGKKEYSPIEFLNHSQFYLQQLEIDNSFFDRNLNEGFSGGEKKKVEILQAFLLQPLLVLLDEIDSGVDRDALQLIGQKVKQYLPFNSSILIITHYPKILDYLTPDYIHIFLNGQIIETGDLRLVLYVEQEGYEFFETRYNHLVTKNSILEKKN